MKKFELLSESSALLSRLHVQFMKLHPDRFRTLENSEYFDKLLRVQNRAFNRDRRRYAAWKAEVDTFIESLEKSDSHETNCECFACTFLDVPEYKPNSGETCAPLLFLPRVTVDSIRNQPREVEPVNSEGQGGNQCRAILDADFVYCDCPLCVQSLETQIQVFA